MIGFKVPKRIYSPIIGSDIVRINENIFKVLEDNCRTPSGVSYMIENREIMMRMFPELFEKLKKELFKGLWRLTHFLTIYIILVKL